MGSEPLFDQVLSADDLAKQMMSLKSQLKQFNMQVTLSYVVSSLYPIDF